MKYRIVKSRLDKDEKFLNEMVEQGWILDQAFYSCMDGMYHYIFQSVENEKYSR